MFLLAWLSASAHEPGLSRVSLDGQRLSLSVARTDAADPPALLDGTTAQVGERPCRLGAPEVHPDDNGFVASMDLDCPTGDAITVTAGWFSRLPDGHRTAIDRGGQPIGLLDAAHPRFDTARAPRATEIAADYLLLGIEHIGTGFDHLVFLLGLLLAASGWREIAAVVTTFTIAHSITLSLAATGLLSISSGIVEPLIALSIAWVGIENLVTAPARLASRRRILLVGLLGLVHGLGFAGVLGEIGFPSGRIALSLAAFNAGVEIGQIAVVLVAIPVLHALQRSMRWQRYGYPLASLGVVAAGLYWLLDRMG